MNHAKRVSAVTELLDRGHIQEIISDTSMVDLLSGPPLRIKWGTDPTSENIHLGRAIPIMLLRDLQKLGHQIVLIIGDFTAEIGDTSDKESERPAVSADVVATNMRTYTQQIGQILDLAKTEVHYNKSWWSQMDFGRFLALTNLFTLAEFSARSNIAKRLQEGKRVSVREMVYPIMQGYDSLYLSADIEVGGTDQRFNMLAGREIQRAHQAKPQALIMTTLINGLDGRKMSSSWGNTINLTDSPNDMLGKLMSMSDDMIVPYLIHLTRIPRKTIEKSELDMKSGKANPRDIKLALAIEIVADLHGSVIAQKAADEFNRVFQERKTPESMPTYAISPANIVDVLTTIGFAESKNGARRLIEQGGARIDGEKVSDIGYMITHDCILRAGKIKFAQIRLK
jgi:tyrosyl-tRNA synthetase